MKTVLAAIVVLSAIMPVKAQEAFMAPQVEHSVLLDVASTSDDYLVIVGERGHILTSVDGVSYTQQAVPTTVTLTSVTTVGDEVWAVGHDATILHSNDRGKHWVIQMEAPDLEKPFLDVLFFDHQQGIAIGAYGLFFRTTNGGETWTQELHATLLHPYDQEYLNEVKEETPEYYDEELSAILPHLNKLYRTHDALYLVGEAGLVAKSTDEGKIWQRMDTGYEGSFLNITALDDHTLMIVGLRGHTFIQKDGQNWQSVPTCMAVSFNAILPTTTNKVLILANNGYVVSLSRPLQTQAFSGWGGQEDCQVPQNLSSYQLDDKASIVNAVRFKDKIIAVSAKGIKQLKMD
ncbi:WD40/YVTN/BNR-like repeat-containing protein [Alteromonas sp. 14N.309.X.WAT.G.H12]|uniref:WD40/YVTN/BNR-like repeat-containing protein n=1 Tax=Alteromonas sp. 14N.309.X.WAT.G.H12 TaxID=3120824 RepID=UPI002FD290B0